MRVILLQDVKNLGRKDEIKDVSEGYVRNFLLPKKLVRQATAEALAQLEKQLKEKAAIDIAQKKKNGELLKKLGTRVFELKMKGKNGKLFGSVSAKNISDELKKAGFDLPEKAILLENNIKKSGEYSVELDLGQHLKTKIELKISAIE